MLTNALLYAGLLPLTASAAIAFIMWRFHSPPPIAWPVATTGGFLFAQFALRSQSGFDASLHTLIQPHEALDWLPHIVLLALGISIVTYLVPAHHRRLLALSAALCFAAPVRLLSGNLAQHWSMSVKLAVLALLAAVLGFVWWLLASNDDKQPANLRVPFLLILVAAGTAIAVTKSGALVYGLLSAAFGAAIMGTALVFALRGISSSAGDAGVITFALGSLIILGHFYAELGTTSAALLFLSLAATSAPLPALLRSGPAWQRNMARFVLCLLPLAISVGVSFF